MFLIRDHPFVIHFSGKFSLTCAYLTVTSDIGKFYVCTKRMISNISLVEVIISESMQATSTLRDCYELAKSNNLILKKQKKYNFLSVPIIWIVKTRIY